MDFDQAKVWRSLTDDPGNYYCNSAEPEREAFRDWVRKLLQEREVTVDFVKADGDFRSMKCTLNESLGAKYSTTVNVKKPNPEVCAVWDTTQGAWRSFRWDRIKRINFTIG